LYANEENCKYEKPMFSGDPLASLIV